MGKVQRNMVRMGDVAERQGRRLTVGLSLPIAGAAAAMVKSSLSIIDAQAKIAQSMDTTVQSMQVLQRAADLAGVSMGETEQATIQFTKRLSQAAGGTGAASKALDRLNLSAADLLSLPIDQRLARVQDALARYVPEAERAAVASELFGSRAGLVFSRIDGATLRLATDDVQRFGVAVSEVDADQIERTNDAISRLGVVGRGIANQLTVALAPALEGISDKVAAAGEWFNDLSDGTKETVASSAALAAALGPVALGLGLVLKLAAPLVGVLAGIASPVGLAVAGFTALAVAGTALSGTVSGSVSFAEAHEIAMDNVTIAMGDQINATARLADALKDGGPITLAAIEAEMAQAEALRSTTAELVRKRQEKELEVLGYYDVLEAIGRYQETLRALRTPGDDLEQMPVRLRASYEEAELGLVALLAEQQRLLEGVRSQNHLTEEEQANLAQIEANLAELQRRWNTLNGITSENVALTDRGAASARDLALGLGDAASQAAAVKSYLAGLPGALQGANVKIAGLKAGIAALSGGGSELTANVAKYRAELEAALPPLNSMADGQRRVVEEGLNRQVQQYEQQQRLNAEYQAAVRALNKVESAGGSASKSAVAQLRKELQHRRSLLEMTDEQRKKLEAILQVQQRLGKEANGLTKEQIELLADQVIELDNAEDAMSRVHDMQRRWSEEITRTAFEGGSLTDTIQGMLRDIAYQFAHSKIVLPIVGSITSILGLDSLLLGGSGGQLAAVGGGGGVNPLGLLSNVGGLVGGGGSFAAGIGSGLGGVLSGGGLGSSFANLGGLLGGSSGFSAGALGAALPAAGLVLGGIALLAKGLSRKYAGSGIRGSFGAEGFEGSQIDFYKGGFLRSNRTVYKPLEAEFEAALDQSVTGLTDGVKEMAASLNLGTEALEGFNSESFTLWTNGKSQEQVQEELQALIAETGAEMAELVLGTDDFSQAGETALDTLGRLSGSLTAVNDAADLLGHGLFDISLMSADTASQLVDQFGGLDAYSASIATYWGAFYSEAERQEISVRRLTEQFADLGVAIPASRAEFRAIVEAIDLNSEAGRELYAELIQMSGAMNEVLPAVENLSTALMGAVDAANSQVASMMASARTAANEAARSAQDWYRAADSLRDLQDDLSFGSTSLLGADDQIAAVRAEMERLSAAAQAGDVDAANAYGGVARRYLDLATSQAGSLVDAQRIAAKIGIEANRLAGVADVEGAADTVLEGLARQQLSVLEELASYLQSAEVIDSDVIAAFEQRLGSLQGAIEGTELSLDFLRQGVGLSIDELDLSSLSPRLQELILGSRDALRATIQFVLGTDDLTPEMRWLALQTTSQHTRTIALLPELDGVSDRVLKLALGASSDLVRNVELAAGAGLDPELLSAVLAENSDLTRTVNLVLGSDLDERSKRLALRGIDGFGDAITSSLEDGVSDDVRAIIAGGAGSYSASLDLALEGDLAPREVRQLLGSQRDLLVGLDAVLAPDMPEATQQLLANAVTNGTRALALEAHFGDQLTDGQRELLAKAVTNAERVVAISSEGDLTPEERAALRGVNRRFERVMDGKVDLSDLTAEQTGFFEAISGVSGGNLNLGGSFEFDPVGAFADSMQEAVGGPVDALSASISDMNTGMADLVSSLGGLRSEIAAYRLRAEEAAKNAAITSRVEGKAEQFDANWGRKSLARTEGLKDQLEALVASTGVSLSGIRLRSDGTLAYNSSEIAGSADQIAAFRASGFWADGGLQDQIGAANANRRRANDYLEQLREKIRNAGGVPGFERGGAHMGGWRVVGEGGWELEHTGPSRVISNSESKAMLDNRAVVAVMEQVLSALSSFHADSSRWLVEMADHTADLAKLERLRETIGNPPVRPEGSAT
jgi:DNA-binding MarR family transcriptional regulator